MGLCAWIAESETSTLVPNGLRPLSFRGFEKLVEVGFRPRGRPCVNIDPSSLIAPGIGKGFTSHSNVTLQSVPINQVGRFTGVTAMGSDYIILDTNILSEAQKPRPRPELVS